MIRHKNNPIITRNNIISDLPELTDVSSVFNPGAVLFNDKFLLLLRVQNRARETLIVKALSDNGIDFKIETKPVLLNGINKLNMAIYHIYDPRISYIDGKFFIITALDSDSGCFLALWETKNFDELSFISLISDPDVRNGVLFPEKINNHYYRLERPNKVLLENGPKTGSTITISKSKDLINWEKISDLFSGRPHYWDELIGSGPPPIKTRMGWLHIYHGVATHFGSSNIYQAGYSLLDLSHPEKVLKRGKYNILEPQELYELTGQVPNVVFPSGMIPLEYDSDGFVKENCDIFLYYGAADTVIGLAVFNLLELLD